MGGRSLILMATSDNIPPSHPNPKKGREGSLHNRPVQGLRLPTLGLKCLLVCRNGEMRTVIQLIHGVYHTDELK